MYTNSIFKDILDKTSLVDDQINDIKELLNQLQKTINEIDMQIIDIGVHSNVFPIDNASYIEDTGLKGTIFDDSNKENGFID